jgi:hypothetical protein
LSFRKDFAAMLGDCMWRAGGEAHGFQPIKHARDSPTCAAPMFAPRQWATITNADKRVDLRPGKSFRLTLNRVLAQSMVLRGR